MEPVLVVPERLVPVLEELRRLELLFHPVNAPATPQSLEELVAPEFWEVGASGRRYSRESVLEVLKERQRAPAGAVWEAKDFHVAEISEHNYLLTYTLRQPGRVTHRATLWRRSAAGWQALYHQGTVASEAQ
jgi:hypothetical protein